MNFKIGFYTTEAYVINRCFTAYIYNPFENRIFANKYEPKSLSEWKIIEEPMIFNNGYEYFTNIPLTKDGVVFFANVLL